MEIQHSVTVWLFDIGCIALGLLFGCSMTFGLWANDDEILPCYVAQYASHYHLTRMGGLIMAHTR